MPFKLKAYLPSQQRNVLIKELCYRQYRDLVKSLHSTDKEETIQQYNSVLEDLCPDIAGIDITWEDKLSLLLTVRNYCVSPDLKLKVTNTDNSIFNFSTSLDKVINTVKAINKSRILTLKDITIEYSSYKVRDEYDFNGNNKDIPIILASYIDNIVIKDTSINFKDYNLQERIKIVKELPYWIITKLYKDIINLENYYEGLDLITIRKPFEKEIYFRVSQNITYDTLQLLISYLFTENLTNIYKAFYNIVKYAGFDAEYIDTITPVEMQVYWMYFLESQKKTETAPTPSGGLNLPAPSGTPNTELGF